MMNITKEAGMKLFDILNIEPICKFCGRRITEENFGGIFNKPTVVFCNNTTCLLEFTKEE